MIGKVRMMPFRYGGSGRIDLSNFAIANILSGVLLLSGVWLALSFLGFRITEPDSAGNILLGVGAMSLFLLPFLFSLFKRTSIRSSPPKWFVLHIFGSIAGLFLAGLHSMGTILSPPGMLLLLGLFLVVHGCWIRIFGSRELSRRFGVASQRIVVKPSIDKQKLADTVVRKRKLLRQIDHTATESQFSLRPRHWLFSPLRAREYARLARREATMINYLPHGYRTQYFHRRLHISLACIFLIAMTTHAVLGIVHYFHGY